MTPLFIVMIALHILIVLVAIHTIYMFSKHYEAPINIHNLPLIIMGFVAMLAAAGFSFTNPLLYLVTGLIVSVFTWWLNSFSLPNGSGPASLYSKIRTSAIAIFFWPQLVYVIAYMFFNLKKIYEKSQH